jgi:ribosomal protein S18 acetylase RimI-like enzyme
MTFTLRRASRADDPALIDLKWEMNRFERASLPDGSIVAPMKDASREAATKGVADYWSMIDRAGGAYWVAERDGNIAASALWTYHRLGPSFLDQERRVGMVCGVVVHPSARGQGLARRLMAKLDEEMRAAGLSHAFLEAVASNAAAVGLYQTLGYQGFDLAMLKRL